MKNFRKIIEQSQRIAAFGTLLLITGSLHAQWNGTGTTGAIDRTGDVGIGVSPSHKLHVQTTNNNYGLVHGNGSGVEIGTYVGTQSSVNGGWLGTRSNSPLYFFTNDGSSQAVLQNGTGNFGIGAGVYNPSRLLHISKYASGSSPNSSPSLLIENTCGGTNAEARFEMATYGMGNYDPVFRMTAKDDGNYSADLNIQTKAQGGLGGPGDNTHVLISRIFIKADGGKVGIGTTSPAEKLDVAGKTKTQSFQMTNGSYSNGYVLATDGSGNGTWTDPTTLLGTGLWTASGNDIYNSNTENVGIGTGTPGAKLHLSDPATSNYSSFMTSNSEGPTLYILHDNSGSNNPTGFVSDPIHYSLVAKNSYSSVDGNYTGGGRFIARNVGSQHEATGIQDNDFSTGVVSYASAASGTTNSASTGVMTQASGANIAKGVHSIAIASGSASTAYGIYSEASGGTTNWAGYFVGDVNINGSAFCYSTWQFSDRRFKKDINQLHGLKEELFKINPYTYQFRVDEFKSKRFSDKKQFGFIAQEVAEVFPALTTTDKDGYLAVNYTEFIPLLLQALKEEDQQVKVLEAKVEQLETKLNDNSSPATTSTKHTGSKLEASVLYQNTPNPFSDATVIKYHIASVQNSAAIMVFDMNGTLIKTFPVTKEAKDGEVQIVSGDLRAGMYFYTLMIDNKEIDTKKMILTK